MGRTKNHKRTARNKYSDSEISVIPPSSGSGTDSSQDDTPIAKVADNRKITVLSDSSSDEERLSSRSVNDRSMSSQSVNNRSTNDHLVADLSTVSTEASTVVSVHRLDNMPVLPKHRTTKLTRVPKTVFVNQTATTIGQVERPDRPFVSIQEAQQALRGREDQWQIIVAAGYYNIDTLTLTNINLTGAGYTTIINGCFRTEGEVELGSFKQLLTGSNHCSGNITLDGVKVFGGNGPLFVLTECEFHLLNSHLRWHNAIGKGVVISSNTSIVSCYNCYIEALNTSGEIAFWEQEDGGGYIYNCFLNLYGKIKQVCSVSGRQIKNEDKSSSEQAELASPSGTNNNQQPLPPMSPRYTCHLTLANSTLDLHSSTSDWILASANDGAKVLGHRLTIFTTPTLNIQIGPAETYTNISINGEELVTSRIVVDSDQPLLLSSGLTVARNQAPLILQLHDAISSCEVVAKGAQVTIQDQQNFREELQRDQSIRLIRSGGQWYLVAVV